MVTEVTQREQTKRPTGPDTTSRRQLHHNAIDTRCTGANQTKQQNWTHHQRRTRQYPWWTPPLPLLEDIRASQPVRLHLDRTEQRLQKRHWRNHVPGSTRPQQDRQLLWRHHHPILRKASSSDYLWMKNEGAVLGNCNGHCNRNFWSHIPFPQKL